MIVLQEDFVLYSLKEKRTLLKIPCGGGGNRKWDFKYGHGKQGSPNASLAFVKDKEIFYTFLPMEGYLGNTLKVKHCSIIYRSSIQVAGSHKVKLCFWNRRACIARQSIVWFIYNLEIIRMSSSLVAKMDH